MTSILPAASGGDNPGAAWRGAQGPLVLLRDNGF